MRTFRVRQIGLATPSLHLVQTSDEAVARAIADVLWREMPGAVGIEMWDGERRNLRAWRADWVTERGSSRRDH
jgi:hypothetical protein